MRTLAAVVGLAVCVTVVAASPDPALTSIDVYQAGTAPGYHTFRIPALIVARTGTLLAFAEGRRGGGC